jgi:hypothetical protein
VTAVCPGIAAGVVEVRGEPYRSAGSLASDCEEFVGAVMTGGLGVPRGVVA